MFQPDEMSFRLCNSTTTRVLFVQDTLCRVPVKPVRLSFAYWTMRCVKEERCPVTGGTVPIRSQAIARKCPQLFGLNRTKNDRKKRKKYEYTRMQTSGHFSGLKILSCDRWDGRRCGSQKEDCRTQTSVADMTDPVFCSFLGGTRFCFSSTASES